MFKRRRNKIFVMIIIVLSLIGLSYYAYIYPGTELLSLKNQVKINYKLSILMNNESDSSCTFYLPGYQNREGDFLDINNDMVIQGENATLDQIETIHGRAFEVMANSSFTMSINETYENKIFINDTSVGFNDFWNLTMYEVDDITSGPSYYIGHLWVYYNGTGCQNNVTLTINEIAHFRFHYSTIVRYTLALSEIIEPSGWNRIPANRTF